MLSNVELEVVVYKAFFVVLGYQVTIVQAVEVPADLRQLQHASSLGNHSELDYSLLVLVELNVLGSRLAGVVGTSYCLTEFQCALRNLDLLVQGVLQHYLHPNLFIQEAHPRILVNLPPSDSDWLVSVC